MITVTQFKAVGRLPSSECAFLLCECLIYRTIIATMMTMMMNNIPPTAPPIAAPDDPDPLLLSWEADPISGAVKTQ